MAAASLGSSRIPVVPVVRRVDRLVDAGCRATRPRARSAPGARAATGSPRAGDPVRCTGSGGIPDQQRRCRRVAPVGAVVRTIGWSEPVLTCGGPAVCWTHERSQPAAPALDDDHRVVRHRPRGRRPRRRRPPVGGHGRERAARSARSTTPSTRPSSRSSAAAFASSRSTSTPTGETARRRRPRRARRSSHQPSAIGDRAAGRYAGDGPPRQPRRRLCRGVSRGDPSPPGRRGLGRRDRGRGQRPPGRASRPCRASGRPCRARRVAGRGPRRQPLRAVTGGVSSPP